MGYVAPDGNTYKYYYETDRYVGTQYHNNYDYKIWSNVKIAGQTFNEYSSGSYLVGLLDENTDAIGELWIGQFQNIPQIQSSTTFGSGGIINNRTLTGVVYMTTMVGNGSSANASIAIKPNDSYFTYASSLSEMKAYLTAPEVFQIPSFSFSGSIISGQNTSLNQGSCSLSSPYITSFSFEGKCRELVSLKQLFYDKTGYTVTDDLVNQTKSYMETHQQHQIYWIGGHDLNGHYGFHVFVCAPGSYFESNAGQGGQLYYKAPTKRWYWNVDSTTHKSVTTLNTYWDFNSDGSSFQIWNTYTFGIVGGYNDYDY